MNRNAVTVPPPRIHTQKHFSPILAFCSTGTRVNCQNGIPMVIRFRKHTFQFQSIDALFQRLKFCNELRFQIFIFL